MQPAPCLDAVTLEEQKHCQQCYNHCCNSVNLLPDARSLTCCCWCCCCLKGSRVDKGTTIRGIRRHGTICKGQHKQQAPLTSRLLIQSGARYHSKTSGVDNTCCELVKIRTSDGCMAKLIAAEQKLMPVDIADAAPSVKSMQCDPHASVPAAGPLMFPG